MSSKSVAPIILPDAIEAESFRIIESEMGPHDFSVLEWPVDTAQQQPCNRRASA